MEGAPGSLGPDPGLPLLNPLPWPPHPQDGRQGPRGLGCCEDRTTSNGGHLAQCLACENGTTPGVLPNLQPRWGPASQSTPKLGLRPRDEVAYQRPAATRDKGQPKALLFIITASHRGGNQGPGRFQSHSEPAGELKSQCHAVLMPSLGAGSKAARQRAGGASPGSTALPCPGANAEQAQRCEVLTPSASEQGQIWKRLWQSP